MESDLERGNGIGGDFGGRTIREEEISSLDITAVAVRPRGGGRGGGARRINRRSGDSASAGTGAGAGAGRGQQAQHIRRSRGQGWMTMLTIHTVFLGANGLLYMLIQIKYQNQRNSPFETHPVVMTSSVVAICVYLCATVLQVVLVQTNNELDDPTLLNHVIVCSGILYLLSNALVFVTHNVGWIVVAIIAFAASILLAFDLFMIISNYISERNNNNNNNINATTTSESLAMEMSSEINNNVNNAATASESMENSIAVNNNNSGTNNNMS